MTRKVVLLAMLAMLLASGFVMAQEPVSDVIAKHAMVSSSVDLATMAGVKVLRAGGNAIDAAVATGLALCVAEPTSTGLGGGGFMVIYFAKTKEVKIVDYREMAAGYATKDMYVESSARSGANISGIPGVPMGYDLALKEFGSMSWAAVAAPAIELAEKGFTVYPRLADGIKSAYTKIEKYNRNNLSKVRYLNPNTGLPLEAGDKIVLPELGKTLRDIVINGPDVFYKGYIGESMVRAINAAGGKWTMDDLTKYKVLTPEPVRGTYRGEYEIISMPPPSSGGAHLIQILNMLEHFDVKAMGHNSVKYLSVLADILKLVFADRAQYLGGDPTFVYNPIIGLTSKEYAKTLVPLIDPNKALTTVKPGNPIPYESLETTHFSVIDEEGNIVAVTQTVNGGFGCGVIATDTGIVMNDELTDFNFNPLHIAAPEPYKRPLSSMSPTIVLKNGEAFMSLGSPGATMIFPTIAQVIVNVIDFGMPISKAVESARIMCNSSGGNQGNLSMEMERGIPQQTADALAAMGHKVTKTTSVGNVQAVLLGTDGMIHGWADSRRKGYAAGY